MEAVAVDKGFAPEPLAAAASAAWLEELRRAAFARFEELGFPTPHDEDWRYTGLQPVTGTNWTRVRREPELMSPPPAGARVRRLSEALSDAQPHLARIARFDASAFAALNTGLLDDALVLEIEKGAVLAEPIQIAFRSDGASGPEAQYPRVLILAGERSQATVIQTYAGQGRYFTNAVTEIALAEGALLEHYVLQQESPAACHVHTLAVRQARASHFTSHNLAFGGALARTDLSVLLDAEGAECTLNGLFVGRGEQHLDNHTMVDHAKPRCVSRQLYKTRRAACSTARSSCGRTRRRPTRFRRTGTCSSRAGRSSTRPRRSRSWPTTSSASMVRRPGSSTPRRSSTCARAGSMRTPRARS
jgi:Fe-S cluster assembly protein SufD